MSLANLDSEITPGDLLALGLVARDASGRLTANGGSIAAPVLFDTSGAMLPSTDSFTTKRLLGIDRVNDYMWVAGSTSLTQYTLFGTVASTDKTQPAGITATTAKKMVSFKGNVYISGVETATGKAAVWQAAPQAGNTVFTWTKVFTASTGANAVIDTGFNVIVDANGNDLALIYGEYADPTGGPQIWRSTDGSVWTSVVGPVAGVRHFHCVVQNPYNPAVVYASAGDGISKPLWKSSDYGVTWAVIITDSNWQCVQISFSPNWLYCAADSARGSVYIVDPATNTPHWMPGYHRYLPVASPLDARAGGQRFADGSFTNGSKTMTSASAAFANTFDVNDVGREVYCPTTLFPNTYITGITNATTVQLSQNAQATLAGQTFVIGGDEFYWSAYYGIVDPATGFYYFTANDNSSGGNRSGLFVHTGNQMLLLDVHEASISGSNQITAEHFIYNGKVWMQGKSHTLIAATRTMVRP